MMMPQSQTYYMPLADGTCWSLRARHPETTTFVERYARVCSLKAAAPQGTGRMLRCYVDTIESLEVFRDQKPHFIETGRAHYFRILISPNFDESRIFFNMPEYQRPIMQELALGNIGVAFQFQVAGPGQRAPCHCALVELNGRGALICGKGDSGKTTCATRIPRPHRALADDYVLLFKQNGRLIAQSMPTWSNLQNGNPDYVADCSQVTEVEAIFFIKQSSYDRVESLGGAEAAARMNACLQDLLFTRTLSNMPGGMRTKIRQHIFELSHQLLQEKPIYTLHATLQGDFWTPMARIMDSG
jgi:hypothetical protein